MKYYRSDQAEIHATFEDFTVDDESWDVLDGGDNVAPNHIVHPGGMADMVSTGGVPIRSEITLERNWSDVMINAYKFFDANAGNLVVPAISYVVLNGPGKPQGVVFTWSGILLSASRPGYKAGESNDAMLKLTIGPQGAMS